MILSVLCLALVLQLLIIGSDMVNVPTFNSRVTPIVTPGSLREPNSSLTAPNTDRLQRGLTDIQLLQEKRGQREAKKLDVEYSARVRELLFGASQVPDASKTFSTLQFGTGNDAPDPDASPGYFGLYGQAAVDGRLQVETELEKIRSDILNKAGDNLSLIHISEPTRPY